MRLLSVCFLSVALFAHDRPWQKLPAQSGAPEIQYRLAEEGQGLRLEVQPGSLDTSKWALHVWLGDPRMVKARVQALKSLSDTIHQGDALLKDPEFRDDSSQQEVHDFLAKAWGCHHKYRDFDPYQHIQLTFAAPPQGWAPDLTVIVLKPVPGPHGERIYGASIPFNGGFDTATPMLRKLSIGVALVAASNQQPLPLVSPTTLALAKPWHMENFFESGNARLFKLLEKVTDPVCLHGPNGYLPGKPDQIQYVYGGNDGHLEAPTFWAPWPFDAEEFFQAGSSRFQFSFLKGFGAALVVQRVGDAEPSLFDLHAQASGAGEEDMKFIACVDTPDATYLVLQISSLSRPGTPGGYCGGGIEEDAVWLKLGLDGTLQKAASKLVGSCLSNIESNFGEDEDGVCAWDWTDVEDNKGHEVSFDKRHPEAGLATHDE